MLINQIIKDLFGKFTSSVLKGNIIIGKIIYLLLTYLLN